MKTQSILLSILVLFVFGNNAFAQKKKTEEIKVWGNCGMCKKTIETAATKAGATKADWNTETKVLTVSYSARKTDAQKIQQAVAAAGYDTQDFTGSNEAYEKLHACCHYDRKADQASGNQQKACCKDEKCSKETCKDKSCCTKDDASCCKS